MKITDSNSSPTADKRYVEALIPRSSRPVVSAWVIRPCPSVCWNLMYDLA